MKPLSEEQTLQRLATVLDEDQLLYGGGGELSDEAIAGLPLEPLQPDEERRLVATGLAALPLPAALPLAAGAETHPQSRSTAAGGRRRLFLASALSLVSGVALIAVLWPRHPAPDSRWAVNFDIVGLTASRKLERSETVAQPITELVLRPGDPLQFNIQPHTRPGRPVDARLFIEREGAIYAFPENPVLGLGGSFTVNVLLPGPPLIGPSQRILVVVGPPADLPDAAGLEKALAHPELLAGRGVTLRAVPLRVPSN